MGWRGVILGLAACLSACSLTYTMDQAERLARHFELIDAHALDRQRPVRLAQGHALCLSLRADMNEAQRAALQREALAVAARYFPMILAVEPALTFHGSAQAARLSQCSVLLDVAVQRFDDKISGLMELPDADADLADFDTGLPVGTDRLWLKIVLWDLNRDALIDTALMRSRTPWLQLLSHQPEQLLPGALMLYFNQIAALDGATVVR